MSIIALGCGGSAVLRSATSPVCTEVAMATGTVLRHGASLALSWLHDPLHTEWGEGGVVSWLHDPLYTEWGEGGVVS